MPPDLDTRPSGSDDLSRVVAREGELAVMREFLEPAPWSSRPAAAPPQPSAKPPAAKALAKAFGAARAAA